VGWLRRCEKTLNERLLREAGYASDGTKLTQPVAPEPATGDDLPLRRPLVPVNPSGLVELGTPHAQLARAWDVFVTADAPELDGDAYSFATLPDGSLIVEDSCAKDLASRGRRFRGR
jgi:hypothetical protein